MSTYQNFLTDETLENSGVTFDYGSVGKFVMARAGGANRTFKNRMKIELKPFQRSIDSGSADDDATREPILRAFVDSVLLGWEGVTGRDGKPLPYNKANAVMLLTDLPDLFSNLLQDAQDHSAFLIEVRDAQVKPQSNSSSGISDGAPQPLNE